MKGRQEEGRRWHLCISSPHRSRLCVVSEVHLWHPWGLFVDTDAETLSASVLCGCIALLIWYIEIILQQTRGSALI